MSDCKKATQQCQCGYFGDALHDCTCTPPLIQRYLARVSGPLLDRIDLHIQVPAVKYKELAQDEKSEESAVIRKRILAARQLQIRPQVGPQPPVMTDSWPGRGDSSARPT